MHPARLLGNTAHSSVPGASACRRSLASVAILCPGSCAPPASSFETGRPLTGYSRGSALIRSGYGVRCAITFLISYPLPPPWWRSWMTPYGANAGSASAETSWRRDPLGPPFADNFIWASRFLQVSIALPEHPEQSASPARAIPVDLEHAPSPRKPSRRAPPEVWDAWRAASAAATVSALGAERITALRRDLDAHPGGIERSLLVCVDGTFTCRTVFRHLPERTTLIGRIRKDARLYALPTAAQENLGRGRQRCYGDRLPYARAVSPGPRDSMAERARLRRRQRLRFPNQDHRPDTLEDRWRPTATAATHHPARRLPAETRRGSELPQAGLPDLH